MSRKLCVLLLLLLMSSRVYSEEPIDRFDLTIETDKSAYKSNDKIVIAGKITNVSGDDMTYYKNLTNGILHDIEISFLPIEKDISSLLAGRQISSYYAPEKVVLKPSESIEIKKVISLSYEAVKFNYKCVEWQDMDGQPKIGKRCVKEEFDEGGRFVVRPEGAESKEALKEVLGLSDGEYTLQAVYFMDPIGVMFPMVLDGESNPQEKNVLSKGGKLRSNKITIKIFQ